METETIPEAPKILGTAKVLASNLITKYGRRESETLTRNLVEFIVQKPYKWLLAYPDAVFSQQEYFQWNAAAARLISGEPLQYVIGRAWFYGLEFIVAPGVLIPRPETEELVAWILEDFSEVVHMKLVDVGTGSGCIPLAVVQNRPLAEVTGVDVSEAALAIAAQNGRRIQRPFSFLKADIFTLSASDFENLDVLVSNPPYIPYSEYQTLDPHVLLHEPESALAVPDGEPLLYYRKIAELGRAWLRPGGYLYFEIHESFGAEVVAMMEAAGYAGVQLRQDMSGRDRMVRGQQPG